MEMVRLAAEQDPTYPRPATPSTPECPSSPATKAEVQLATTPSGQWIVPNNQGIRTFLISEAHDQITSGHFGEQKTWDRLSQHWSWKGAREDVKEYIRTCASCQKIKAATHKPPGLLHPIVSTEPGEILTLDFVSKFTPAAKTGNQQCLVFVDKFSRFTFLNGCPMTISARGTAEIFLQRIIPILGVPKKIISDRGTQFTASLWRDLLEMLGAKVALATSHHPQTDGQSERAVQTVIRLLRTFAGTMQENWEGLLPLFEISINTSTNATTGETPSRILFGRNLRLPLEFAVDARPKPAPVSAEETDDEGRQTTKWIRQLETDLLRIHAIVRGHQGKAIDRYVRQYDLHRKPLFFEPSDWVLLSTRSHHSQPEGSTKQQERFQGPYVIGKRIHQNAYELRGLPPSVPKTQNVQYLRPFCPNPVQFRTRPVQEYATPVDTDDGVEWEVEDVLHHRITRAGWRYKVKWKNSSQNQWLREEHLLNCIDLLRAYHSRHNIPEPPFLTQAFADRVLLDSLPPTTSTPVNNSTTTPEPSENPDSPQAGHPDEGESVTELEPVSCRPAII